MDKRILTHYQTYAFNSQFWELTGQERKNIVLKLLEAIKGTGEATYFYQVFPSRTEYDFMSWVTVNAEELDAPEKFFRKFSIAVNPFRKWVDISENFWGITKPSVYSKSKRSPQEIDPFNADERTPYFIVYPFTKTPDWYLESGEDRMEMMKKHIQLGKQYKEITQLLLYSFGLQDQEFIVSYETKDLAMFSDLVYDLRSTRARIYTLSDTPIITGVLKKETELLELFS